MTAFTFEAFKIVSQANYAANLARVEDISIEEALANASTQFQKLVPNGPATVDHLFFDALEERTNKHVGFLWLGFQNRFGRKIACIYDIHIHESDRGRGFGKALMNFADQESRSGGATRVRLHVFYDNEVAKQLYLSMGFAPTNLDMRKDLAREAPPRSQVANIENRFLER